jgi:hypothetical protein
VSGSIDVLGVRYESIDFIDHVWERAIYAGEVAINDLVGTDGSTDSVIIEHGAGVDRYLKITELAYSKRNKRKAEGGFMSCDTAFTSNMYNVLSELIISAWKKLL